MDGLFDFLAIICVFLWIGFFADKGSSGGSRSRRRARDTGSGGSALGWLLIIVLFLVVPVIVGAANQAP